MTAYRVYVWKSADSQEPELVKEVEAASPDKALQRVMVRSDLYYVSYAWIVPLDESLPSVDRYRVRFSSLRLGKKAVR